MARSLFVVLSIAFNSIGPVLFPQDTRSASDLLNELEAIITQEATTSRNFLRDSFAPFTTSDNGVDGALQSQLKKWYVQQRLESDPEFRAALMSAMKALQAN